MTDLTDKVACDPYYRHTYRHYGSLEALTEAGFFDDGLAPKLVKELSDRCWLVTPLSKIKETDSPRALVLLTTGGFAPVHEGHISMMESARRKMTDEGYEVIGGFMAPAHDGYVSTKGDSAELFPWHLRLEQLYKAVAASDWLMPDPWMGQCVPGDVDLNFTDVMQRLEKYINTHLQPKHPIEVVYVFGGDNAGFAKAFIGRGRCVCVTRPGFEEKIERIMNDPDLASTGRIYFAKGDTDISSRAIRTGQRPGLDCLCEGRTDWPSGGNSFTYSGRPGRGAVAKDLRAGNAENGEGPVPERHHYRTVRPAIQQTSRPGLPKNT